MAEDMDESLNKGRVMKGGKERVDKTGYCIIIYNATMLSLLSLLLPLPSPPPSLYLHPDQGSYLPSHVT